MSEEKTKIRNKSRFGGVISLPHDAIEAEASKGNLFGTIDAFAKQGGYKVVMHFPHSGRELPDIFYDDVFLEKEEIAALNLKMSDLELAELFEHWPYEKVIAAYSRLVVDVERYWDESRETMARYGMAAVYEKDIYGRKLHRRSREYVAWAKEIYDRHHEALSSACDDERDILLLDIHSFNEDIARVSCPMRRYPDVCIGFDVFQDERDETIQRLTSLIRKALSSKQRANPAEIFMDNVPFAGAIYPNRTNGRNKIVPIMLEFNKRWYL